MNWLKRFEIFQKKEPKVSNEFKDSLELLGWSDYEKGIIGFSKFLGVVFLLLFLSMSFYFFIIKEDITLFLFLAIISPILINHYVTEYPKIKARNKRLEALGNAPEILMNLIISLKQNSNLENSILFAARNGKGLLAKDLKEIVWKAISGHKISIEEELGDLAYRWGKFSIGLKRALYLIRESLSERNKERRNNILDKALEISLKDLLDKAKDYNTKLYVPTLVLFSFGTIMPLIIISLFPISSFLGLNLANPINLTVLLFISIIGLFIYSENLIKNRPFSFSSLELKEEKPHISIGKKKMVVDIKYLVLLFLAFSFPGILYIFTLSGDISYGYPINVIVEVINTHSIIISLGIVLFLMFYASSHYLISTWKKYKKMEEELPDFAFQIANKLAEGVSPEKALIYVKSIMTDSEISIVLEKIIKKIYNKNQTINEAIRTSILNLHSKVVKSVFEIMSNSLEKGVNVTSQVMFSLSNYLNEIKTTENELRNSLSKTTSMMKSTALFFSPIIGGLMITMYELIKDNLDLSKYNSYMLILPIKMTLQVSILQLILGVYILVLGIILIRFVSKINYGEDKIILRYEISKSIPIILLMFSLTIIITKVIL